jgi:hypothetical protein
MPIDFRRSHSTGLHNDKPHPACKYCTAERDAADMRYAHECGRHEKLPRQKCPDCKAARAAQVLRREVAQCLAR